MPKLLLAISAVFVLAAPGSVQAQSGDAKAYARALERGLSAQQAGRHERATEQLARAIAAQDTPEARLALAESQIALEAHTAAVANLSTLVGKALGDQTSRLRSLLDQAGSALDPVSITIQAGAPAAVLVDGSTAGQAPGAIAVHPGLRSIRVEAQGYTAAEEEVLVLPGEPFDLAFELEALSGTVRVRTDSAGVVARLAGQDVMLSAGAPEDVTAPAGPIDVIFERDGVEVGRRSVTVPAGGAVEAQWLGFGKLAITGFGDGQATVSIAGERREITATGAPIAVPAGEHVMVVELVGHHPVRGTVAIEGGRTTVVTVPLEPLPDRSVDEALGWAALGTGFAAILTVIIVDQTVDFDDRTTEDATIWTLASVGTALTVTGGLVLRDVFEEIGAPETRDVDYGVTIGVAPTDGGAFVSGGFSF